MKYDIKIALIDTYTVWIVCGVEIITGQFHFSIVDVKIAFKISGSFLVSRQTKPLPAGSCLVNLSA